MKRLIAVLLALTLCLTMGVVSACAEKNGVTLRLAENQTADSHLAMAMLKFKELVEKRRTEASPLRCI